MGAFYLRRARRLLPALVVLSVAALIWGARPTDVGWSVSYLTNWHLADGHDLGALSHTWSLAIEEQFYLLWPGIFVIATWRNTSLRRYSAIAIGLAVLVVASHLWRIAHADLGPVAYYRSDMRAGELLLGCAIAVVIAGRIARPRMPSVLVAAAVAAMFVVGCVTTESRPFYDGFGIAITAAGAGVIIAALAATDGPAWLRSTPLTYLGRISYGAYLWHWPIMTAAHTRFPSAEWWIFGPATIALSIGVAHVSYQLVERRFVRRRATQAAGLP